MANDIPWISTAFGCMPLPPCAYTFIKAANGVKNKTRSRVYRKAVRYRKYVDIYALKQYQAGVVFDQTMAPTWGEFDLHDMATSQK